MGFDGEIQNIVGREAMVQAFAATINSCKAVYHINVQHSVELNDDLTEATLVNEVDGEWYIKRRRTFFIESPVIELNGSRRLLNTPLFLMPMLTVQKGHTE